ncbi:hypothetical protein FOBRF1_008245 [Fusarium oxysporum]
MHKVVHLSRYAPTALFGISAKVTFSAPLVAACPANNLNVLVVATPVSVPSMVYHIVMVDASNQYKRQGPSYRIPHAENSGSRSGVPSLISDMPFAASVF